MSSNKLGLPLSYGDLHQYFDTDAYNEDAEAKNQVIGQILKKYNVQSVLDLTCGTGSQVFFLAKLGYRCTGADFSPALLEIARKRSLEQNMDIKFIDGDMRTLQVGEFDAVITIFNAIGHLTKNDFEIAIKNIYSNLKNGGIYVFDILNLDAMTDEVVANLAYFQQQKVADTQLLSMQCSTIDRENGILTSYDSYMLQKNASSPEKLENKFSLQIYTANELQEILSKNGFEIVEQLKVDEKDFSKKTSTSILTAGRRRKQ